MTVDVLVIAIVGFIASLVAGVVRYFQYLRGQEYKDYTEVTEELLRKERKIDKMVTHYNSLGKVEVGNSWTITTTNQSSLCIDLSNIPPYEISSKSPEPKRCNCKFCGAPNQISVCEYCGSALE